MNIRRRQFLRPAAGAVAPPAISRVATAQTYPSRPITIVVPFPASGALDVFGRILTERMKAALDALVKVNAEKWWPIIKELRIKAE